MTASQRSGPSLSDADRARFSWAPPTDLAAIRESLGTLFVNEGADYHTGEQFESAANRVLGPHNWSARIIETLLDAESDEFTMLVELSVTVWLVDPVATTEFIPTVVVKQDYGSQKIRRSRASGVAQSLGDARKGAMTDGIKRCLRQLGFGWYAWSKEDLAVQQGRARATESDQDERPERPTPVRREQPAPAAATAEEQRAFGLKLQRAQADGMPHAAWMDDPIERLTTAQVARYSALIDGFRQRQRGAA